jgi:hypothetical protein
MSTPATLEFIEKSKGKFYDRFTYDKLIGDTSFINNPSGKRLFLL